MDKRYILNEGEYKFILTETLHYPKFLNNIKEEILLIIIQNVSDMVKSNENYKEIIYNMKDNDLFDNITL